MFHYKSAYAALLLALTWWYVHPSKALAEIKDRQEPHTWAIETQLMETKNMGLKQIIAEIAEGIGDLTSPDSLFQYRSFMEIYEDPLAQVREANALLTEPEVPALNKMIVSYAMQRLPPKEYLSWLGFAVQMAENGHLSIEVLQALAFPPLNWNTFLAENYHQPQVRDLLERLAALPDLDSNWRTYILQEVLTGEARNDVLDLREAGQIP